MQLTELLTTNLIRIGLQSRDKRGIVEALVGILASAGKVAAEGQLVEAAMRRGWGSGKRIESTGALASMALSSSAAQSIRLVSAPQRHRSACQARPSSLIRPSWDCS